MPLLLSQRPGVVVAIEQPQATAPLIYVEGLTDAGGAALRSVVTGVTLQRQARAAVNVSFDDVAYAYAFGENPGPLTISGLAFAGMCPEFGGGVSGLAALLDWYDRHRIGSPTGGLRRTVIGGSYVLVGLLRGLQLSMNNPDQQLSTFSLQFETLPPAPPRRF